MTAQKVEGYQSMLRNLQHFFRSEINNDIIDEQSIADSIHEAEIKFTYAIADARVHWMTRHKQYDDTGLTDLEQGLRQVFIDSDAGITDLYRIARMWRVDPTGNLARIPLDYLHSASEGAAVHNPGTRIGSSFELWTETGDVNAATGRHEQAIWIFNPEQSLPGGHLLFEYWFHPTQVTVDDLHLTDENGDFTKGPPLHRMLWFPILNYAKWVLAELAEEPSRS